MSLASPHGVRNDTRNDTPQGDWWLDDVLVETALHETPDGGGHTETVRAALRISDGAIAEVRRDQRAPVAASVVEGRAGLLLPSFTDAHVHLDKTLYGGPWRAPTSARPWPERLREEERLLPEMSDAIPLRSNAILDLLVANGTTRVVAHCNVDHIVGTRNVERVLEVLRARTDIDGEVVAYPQHGLRNGSILPMLAEALDAGATIVGGLDPGSVEGDIDGTLERIFDLATRYAAGVDLHLHDGGPLGLDEIDAVTRHTVRNALQGRVSLSCASALGSSDGARVRGSAERLAAAGVRVGTTMSAAGGPVIPIPMLDELGVTVGLGSDSIMDILTPFGAGDILEQLWILAQRFGRYDERGIARTLHYGAGEPARWRPDGTRRWPAVGDEASFVVVPASCSAEAIARRVRRDLVVNHGRIAFSTRDSR